MQTNVKVGGLTSIFQVCKVNVTLFTVFLLSFLYGGFTYGATSGFDVLSFNYYFM